LTSRREVSVDAAGAAARERPDAAALARFFAVFGVPPFLEPWWDRFFDPAEIALVLEVSTHALSGDEVRRRLPGWGDEALERSWRRGVVDRESDGRWSPADMHARFEVWALFEGWKDVPADVKAALNAWELDHYEQRKRPQIDALLAGREPSQTLENSEYLLLHEAEALLDLVDQVYLWPCNCRAMTQGCQKPVLTCLRFSNNRGLGWEISRERARDVLRDANRAGLMQTGEVAIVDGRVDGAICNCCADCCYPHRVTERLGAAKLWPRSRYVARRLVDACTSCGRCARRCPFGAFVAGEETVPTHRAIEFIPERCRGCGLCATGCPEGAIVMDPLAEVGS
jgi:ferredoxin